MILTRRWATHCFSQFVVLDENGTVGIGGIRPTTTDDVGEVGYMFAPQVWGKGYASEAVTAWTDWAFQTLHLHAIIAEHVTNPASIQSVYSKMVIILPAVMRTRVTCVEKSLECARF